MGQIDLLIEDSEDLEHLSASEMHGKKVQTPRGPTRRNVVVSMC